MDFSTFLPRPSGLTFVSASGCAASCGSGAFTSSGAGLGSTLITYSTSLTLPADLGHGFGTAARAGAVFFETDSVAGLSDGAGESSKIEAIPAIASDQLLKTI